MPTPKLKICGLRTLRQAKAVASLGVDAIGVIAVRSSPRWLEPSRRPALFGAVGAARRACRGVLVVADPGDDDWPELGPEQGHQVLQLHGSESPSRCSALGLDLGCAIWKALRIRTASDLDLVERYAGAVEAVLLDAWVPDQLGGSGRRIPLEWLDGFAPSMPWWLAGGMGPESAAAVLKRVRPHGLDVSSAVEVSPGIKDLGQVSAMLRAVHGAAQDSGWTAAEPMG